VLAGSPFIYVNQKPLAVKTIPVHLITEKLFSRLSFYAQNRLKDYLDDNFYTSDPVKKKNTPRVKIIEFLKERQHLYHAFFITYSKSLILLGINELFYKTQPDNNFCGITIADMQSYPLIYPDNAKLMGAYVNDRTYYKTTGLFEATLAQAAAYVLDLFPKDKYLAYYKSNYPAFELSTSVQKLFKFIKNYVYQADRNGNILIKAQEVERIFFALDNKFKNLQRPAGLGLCFTDPTI
jgi:hypothetical protein